MQLIKFLLVSGVGWLIDFCGYLFLTHTVGIDVGISNFLSAIPSITYVFILSTRKIFQNNGKLPLYIKYVIYFIYQMILLSIVSLISQGLYDLLHNSMLFEYALISRYAKILIKLAITPITMTSNYFVMRYLSERL